MMFYFGSRQSHDQFKVEAPTLARAIRAFRVGCPFPHRLSTAPVWEEHLGADGYRKKIARASEPGAYIPVHDHAWEEVAQIPPVSAEDTYTPADLGPALLGVLNPENTNAGTALAVTDPDSSLTFTNATRRDLEERQLELERIMGGLEVQKRELAATARKLQEELKARMEQIWLIELFLGSNEIVKVLRQGEPAPADTKITAHQRVLCMDEELAVFDWLENPERVGEFDCQCLNDFDAWLVKDPRHLAAILPEPKGIVALRIRRQTKDRQGDGTLATAWANAELADADRSTYLLIRNGENLYRLWVDVTLWPRFIPRATEWDRIQKSHFGEPERDCDMQKRVTEGMKRFAAGFLVINGLLQRSTLFHPIPAADIDVFRTEDTALYFNLVLDDEIEGFLGDGRAHEHLTWNGYEKWLESQAAPGVRVFWTGKPEYGDRDRRTTPLEDRTGRSSLGSWPRNDEVYTLEEREAGYYQYNFQFKYLPDERTYPKGAGDESWEGRPRQRRVSFAVYTGEVVPIDFVSWRVLEHLIRDRGQRSEYASFFRLAFHFWKFAKAEAEREKPFIDLVLAQCEVDQSNEQERARAERLLRWWKLKVKEHRTLGTDEAKALRMICQAFNRGDDADNDPEKLLVSSGASR